MISTSKLKAIHFKTLLLGMIAILLAVAMVKYPSDSFHGSLRGLTIWWDIIFPALLPFFITSEILLGFGVVHFIGVLLEPLMKPFFNVPGVGAFVLAMGFASGYPMGAKLTARLREQNLISKIEGERLVSFTSTSDPLFIFGAIAVGFFHDPKLGAILALIHYSSSILVGFIMKYYKKNEPALTLEKKTKKNTNIIIRAFKEMHHARIKDGRMFGKLMGDAVMSSIESLLMIGGFIIIFSVILTILTKIGITVVLSKIIAFFLSPFGISSHLSPSFINGLFEVTLGAKAASEASMAIPFIQKIVIVSTISAWSGISVHAQVAALLQKTDIKYTPFFFARILHSLLAFVITFMLWKPLNAYFTVKSIPAFVYRIPDQTSLSSIWKTFMYLSTYSLYLIIFLVVISLTLFLLKRYFKKA